MHQLEAWLRKFRLIRDGEKKLAIFLVPPYLLKVELLIVKVNIKVIMI